MITLLKGSYNKGNFKFLRDCIDVPCQEYYNFPLTDKCAKCKNKRVCMDIMQLQMYLTDLAVKPSSKISKNQQ